MDLVKATLTHLETLESVTVLWNPQRYWVARRTRPVTTAIVGEERSPIDLVAGGEAVFTTELLLDSTRNPPGSRDLRPLADKLSRWMAPSGSRWTPARVLFHWGTFRFRGVLVQLEESWVHFDPDGTPVRGWLRLSLQD